MTLKHPDLTDRGVIKVIVVQRKWTDYTPLIFPEEGLLSVVDLGFGVSTLGLYL